MTQIHTGLELLVLLRQLLQLLLGCFHVKNALSARCPAEQKSGCLVTFFVSPVPFAALAGQPESLGGRPAGGRHQHHQ
jgi:hypothetical protein